MIRSSNPTHSIASPKSSDRRSSTQEPSLQGLLTCREAAKFLSISERTLWSLTGSGAIARVRIGRSVRYDIADLRGYIDRQKFGSRA